MKIVMAANWWYRRGGLGSVMFDEAEWLTRRSHDVIPFASAHPANEVTPWAGYFPSFRETSGIGAGEPPHRRLKTAARLVHNVEAAERFDALVRDVKPDLVHLHNTVRQLSPSILGVARRHRVPVVMTLHDYGLVCPQGQLYKAERAACTPPNCVRGNVVHAVVNRCVKRSLAGSVLEAMRSGRPVIASRIGGHEEMLEHGGGTLVPVADVGGLASAVASLWTDRDAATRLGAEAREVFVRKYRIDTHMERLLTVYAEALGG